jgi:hypothetical protein
LSEKEQQWSSSTDCPSKLFVPRRYAELHSVRSVVDIDVDRAAHGPVVVALADAEAIPAFQLIARAQRFLANVVRTRVVELDHLELDAVEVGDEIWNPLVEIADGVPLAEVFSAKMTRPG